MIQDTGELLAVKEMAVEMDEKKMRDQCHEIQLMIELDHPNCVRVLGADSVGLSARGRAAQSEVLAMMAAATRPARPTDRPNERSDAFFFREDLSAEGGAKILADVLEAMLGAVALQEGGLEGAQRSFARVVLPPPEVLAALANGEIEGGLEQRA